MCASILKVFSRIAYKGCVEISPVLQIWCSWGEVIRFWGQKVIGKVLSRTKCCQISFLGGIFSPVSKTHRHILVKRSVITHYQVHKKTLMTFLRSWFKGQGIDNSLKMHFSIWDIPMNGLPLKTIWSCNNVFAIIIIFRWGEAVARLIACPVLRSCWFGLYAHDTTHRLLYRALSYGSDTIRVPVQNKNSVNLVAKLQKKLFLLCCHLNWY